MIKCKNCEHCGSMSAGTLTPGGQKQYVVTCHQVYTVFEIVWNASISDLPCWRSR